MTEFKVKIAVLENGDITINGATVRTGAQTMPRNGYLREHMKADMRKLRKRLRAMGIHAPRGLKPGLYWVHKVSSVSIVTWEARSIGEVCVDLSPDDGEPLRAPWEKVDTLDGKAYTRRDAYVWDIGGELIPLK